jgi:hypothetical protein
MDRYKYVANYWKHYPLNFPWIKWKTTHVDLNLSRDTNLEPRQGEATLQKIIIKQGPYILRWGHSSKGTFTIKESYDLKSLFHLMPKDNN